MRAALAIVLLLLIGTSDLLAQNGKDPKTGQPVWVVDDSLIPVIARLQKDGEWAQAYDHLWDDAIATAKKTGKLVMAFNVDYVDSASIGLRKRLLNDPTVKVFLLRHFELATNDFSVDPPISVGLDSLRNLGLRLDGLEKGYGIAVRPTAIILRADSQEVERIPMPNMLTSKQFIALVTDYLNGKNTVQSLRAAFWKDTTNFEARKKYFTRLTERADYDSVVYQLSVISMMKKDHPDEARDAARQLVYLKLNVEGKPEFLKQWVYEHPKKGSDSLEALQGLRDILEYYQSRKKIDSIASLYNQIFVYTNYRDPELLNNYAWDLTTYSKKWEEAMKLSDEAIAAKPKNADFYDTHAFVNYSLKRFDKAIEDEKLAVKYAKRKQDKKYFSEQVEFYKKQLKSAQEQPKKDSGGE